MATNTHHTKLKGDIGLAAVIKDLTAKGFYVSIPISESAPFDLVASDNQCSYRVQVKARSTRKGTLEVRYRTSWADRKGIHYTQYADDAFDVLAIYAIERDKCLYFKRGEESSITIRFDSPKNDQIIGVKLWSELQSFPPSETIRGAPKD